MSTWPTFHLNNLHWKVSCAFRRICESKSPYIISHSLPSSLRTSTSAFVLLYVLGHCRVAAIAKSYLARNPSCEYTFCSLSWVHFLTNSGWIPRWHWHPEHLDGSTYEESFMVRITLVLHSEHTFMVPVLAPLNYLIVFKQILAGIKRGQSDGHVP